MKDIKVINNKEKRNLVAEGFEEMYQYNGWETFRCPVTSTWLPRINTRRVSPDRLGLLISKGIEAFTEKTGINPFPGNWIWSNRSGQLMLGDIPDTLRWFSKRVRLNEANEIISQFARMGGWIKAAAELPGLRKVVQKNPNLVPELWNRYPSPGGLERKLWATKKRADSILSVWGPQAPKVAWVAVATSLLQNATVGKAAVIAAAKTLSEYADVQTYRQARQRLIDFSSDKKTWDTSDGILCLRTEEPVLEKIGVRVFQTRTSIKEFNLERFKVGFLVVSPAGETYHDECSEAFQALKNALSAFRRRREIMTSQKEVVGFLKGEMGYTPLITLQDSYSAGNCVPGTESWIKEKGLIDCRFIPGFWLIPFLEDERVLRVAQAALTARQVA